MTLQKQKMLPLTAIAVIAASLTIGTAYAAIVVTNDEFFSFGKKYWGEKPFNNSYSGDQSFFCRTTGGSAQASCTGGLIDGRTNYVKHSTKLAANDGKSAWSSAIQGTTPWGYVDTTNGGASNHNTKFPRIAIDDYELDIQYAWFKDTDGSQFADSYPSGSATNGVVHGALLTDLWFKHKSDPDVVLVIDFAWANVENENGDWVKEVKTIGGSYSTRKVTENPNDPGQCIYHYNVVLDNNQNNNTWRAKTSAIKTYISAAFGHTYTDESGGVCGTQLPNRSSTTEINNNYDLVDIETGVEVFVDSQASQNWGTLIGAYSKSKLTDTT